ncbi:uncharacterized protein [Malus domestica]|uniref:uncharacterized protein n=1 Tax=Malus domestica TaxID=3750 RepID=UPI000498F5FE
MVSDIISITIQTGSNEEPIYLLGCIESSSKLCLIRKELGAQLPVFYTSKAFIDVKTRYPKIKKLILALVVASRKLRPYFQGHLVIVMTRIPTLHGDKSLGIGILHSKIHPKPKRCNHTARKRLGSSRALLAVPAPPHGDFWPLQIDGSSNHQGFEAGLVLTTPNGSMLKQAITLSFKASNNEAEYEVLLAGFRLANDLVVKKLAICSDSQLITNETSGEFATKHPKMARYLKKVREQLATFQAYTLTQVPQTKNAHADALASLGFALDYQLRRSILVEYLEKPKIDEEPAVKMVQINIILSWQDPIINYLVNGTFPADRLKSRKLQMKAACYYIWNGMLVRRFFSRPHLRYQSPPDDLRLLAQSMKASVGIILETAHWRKKTLNASYYWSTMHQDAKDYVQKCDSCQCFKPVPSLPTNELHPQMSP